MTKNPKHDDDDQADADASEGCMRALRITNHGEGRPNKKCTLISSTPHGEPCGDKYTHVPGSGACDFLTLCGHCWPTGCDIWETTEKTITCNGCRDVLRVARGASRAGLRAPRARRGAPCGR